MPLIHSSAEALRYIDAQPSAEAIQSASALIQAEVDADSATTLHPLIPFMREPKFSDLVDAEHTRLSSGLAKDANLGIDLSRYEALDAPNAGETAAWRSTLQQAYASAEYLKSREVNLGLLETYGKNAWLVSNNQLEGILKGLEREVENAKVDLEAVEQARRAAQSNVAGEMEGLEQAWRRGVGRMIEAQAAGEDLRQQILERKRMGAI